MEVWYIVVMFVYRNLKRTDMQEQEKGNQELLEQVLREILLPNNIPGYSTQTWVSTEGIDYNWPVRERSGDYDHFDYSHYKSNPITNHATEINLSDSINSESDLKPYRVCDINNPDFENLMNKLIDYSLNHHAHSRTYYAFYKKLGAKDNFVINIDHNMMYDISSIYSSNGLPGLLSYILGSDLFYRSVHDGQIASAKDMIYGTVDLRGFTNAGNYIYGIFSKYDKIMQDKSDALMERVSEWSNGKKDEHLDNVSDSLRNLLDDGV